MGVFARKDLTGIGSEIVELLRRGEGNFTRVEALLGFFGGAHVGKRR